MGGQPQSPDIRLLAIDLDGTLLDNERQPCPLAARSLLALPALGVRVVIASARPPRSVRHIYQSLGLNTWQINYNGALIWDEPGRRVIEHTPMDCATVRRIIDRARGRFPAIQVSCEILDRWHTDRFEQAHTTETGRLFKPDDVAPLDDFCNRPITKLMFLGETRIISELEQSVAAGEDVTLIRSDPDLIQITHPAANKAAALQTVAVRYGVPMEHVMAIGDATNDIPMLAAAGVAVAMDNAPPSVKAVADWVAPSNQDHGVFAALEKYLPGLRSGR